MSPTRFIYFTNYIALLRYAMCILLISGTLNFSKLNIYLVSNSEIEIPSRLTDKKHN